MKNVKEISLDPYDRQHVRVWLTDMWFKDIETDDEAQRNWDSSKTKAKTTEDTQPKPRKGKVNMADVVNKASFVAL